MTEQMHDVDHTHPHTNEPFGDAFARGPAVAADGGRDDRTDETETMADVDHTTDEGVDRAYERGTEGRDETV